MSSFCVLSAFLGIDQLDQNGPAIHLPSLIGAEHGQHVANAGQRFQFRFQLLHELRRSLERRSRRKTECDFEFALVILREKVLAHHHEQRNGREEHSHRQSDNRPPMGHGPYEHSPVRLGEAAEESRILRVVPCV